MQQTQQRPVLPETKWEFTFLQLWNNKRTEKHNRGKKMLNDKELEQRNYKKKIVLRYEYDKNGGVALGHMIKNNFELFPPDSISRE